MSDTNFNIKLSLDSENENVNLNEKEKKDESTLLSTIQDITNNSTSTTFMVAIASHLILNSMKIS